MTFREANREAMRLEGVSESEIQEREKAAEFMFPTNVMDGEIFGDKLEDYINELRKFFRWMQQLSPEQHARIKQQIVDELKWSNVNN